jgi:sarcosine oxidase subunit alpha
LSSRLATTGCNWPPNCSALVVDARSTLAESSALAKLRAAGVEVLAGHTIQSAYGGGRVTSAEVVPVASDGHPTGVAHSVTCDLIVQALGYSPATELLYEAGARFSYDERLAEFTTSEMPAGLFAAGHAAATHEPAAIEREARLAGLEAASHAGFGDGAAESALAGLRAEVAADRAARQPHNLPFYLMPDGHGKSFICLCEDVSEKDVHDAVTEGYNSVELLKRYSTISMGPCQGKMCSPGAMAICARENGWTIAETGTTTARPPSRPLAMGALGGRLLSPLHATPMHTWNVAHGAKMINAGAFKRAELYPDFWQGDKYAEIRAVRERVGLIDVSTLGKLQLRGPADEVARVLERLYVNKWKGLGVGRVRYGVMCNDEGVVMDDGVTARLADDLYYMTTTSTGSSGVYEWILWWLQSGWPENVQVVNVTDAYAAINVAGPRSRDLLAKLTDVDMSKEAFPYMHAREGQVAGVPARLLRIGFTGELSYEMHVPASYGQYMWESLMEAGREFGVLPFGLEAQRVLRLEKKHIIIGQDTDAISNAIEADLGWAVKLDKDDFLGKPALFHVDRDGKRNALFGFEMAEPGVIAEEGNQIVEARPDGRLKIIGYVTSSRWSPTVNKAIGLCWLPASFNHEGQEFSVRLGGALHKARVTLEPFYDPKGEKLRS